MFRSLSNRPRNVASTSSATTNSLDPGRCAVVAVVIAVAVRVVVAVSWWGSGAVWEVTAVVVDDDVVVVVADVVWESARSSERSSSV